ncbi:MAG: hypothetical protein Kow00124_05280 [Anaerolineae bacterium]
MLGLPAVSNTMAAAGSLYCPVLMYHYISDPPEDADRYRRDLSVSPAQFAAHLDTLLEQGFTAISPALLHTALAEGADLLPDKPVILTFDDGYADAYASAFPLLAERGMTGTFFIVSGFMDQPGYLSWAQAGEMLGAGMAIESHSATHPDLTTLGQDALAVEVEESAAAIERTLGVRPQTFCYPLGRWSRRVVAALQNSGYLGAFTTRDGTLHTTARRYQMPRLRVRGRYTARTIDWLVNRRV